MMKLILGSASKWRAEILRAAGYEFEIMSADIDERLIRDRNPKKMALAIANAKADALIPRVHQPSLLITVDQVVYCGGKIFEKPHSADEARNFMQSYNRYPAKTITAVVVVNTKTLHRLQEVDIATVYFKKIPATVIEQLISEGEIFGCAGGFQIEGENGELNPYIKKVKGEIDSVKGLPMKLLTKMLVAFQN